MPETAFSVELPDGSVQPCHSPSEVVREFFTPGEVLQAQQFIALSREALREASKHVRQSDGTARSEAHSSLEHIEEWAGALPPDAPLTVYHV